MRFEPENDNNILFRIVNYLNSLSLFCLCIGLGSLIATLFINDDYTKGLYTGVSAIAVIIFAGTLSFLMSLIPKDDIDEIYKMLEEELNRHKEEKKKKRKNENKQNDEK